MSRAGRYELVRPLARGGMAEVFLARRRSGGVEKLLVVKRIRAERANDVRFQELFKREAKLSMSLAHQNIVPVFDFGRIGERFFLAMERVEGKDLGSTLGKGELPPPLVAAFLAAECCQALDYAHSRKNPDGTGRDIVHRDVTPRNVLLSWSGEVKLTDFGIASLAGEDAKVVGTPAYMAPEQARGEAVDPRSDIYGLGMVLREALTGVRARPGETQEALLASARAGTLAPWPANELSPTLVAIIDRATAAVPSDRFTEVQEFATELDAYIVGERAANRGGSPAKQLSAWLARVWGAQRDDEPEGGAELDGPFVSFLDDAIGTGTERSLAATAADDVEPIALANTQPAAPERPPTIEPAVAEVAPHPSSRRRAIVGVAVIAACAALAIWLGTRNRSSTVAPDSAIATVDPPRDAAAIVEPPVIIEPDAALVVSPPDATLPADAARPPRRPTPGSKTVVRAGSGSAVGAVATRKVHINATPWAYFTVDGGPKMQTPKLLELTPGPHRIHFENDVLKIQRDITLDVPADRDISYVEPLK